MHTLHIYTIKVAVQHRFYHDLSVLRSVYSIVRSWQMDRWQA